MITIRQKGDFKNTERFLSKARQLNVRSILQRYGDKGVLALAAATPVDSGKTSTSWDYRITTSNWGYSIGWFNSNINNGVPVAIIIQYGHGTGTGGYVPPRDYINPAMKSIFDPMAEEIWKEVSRL